MSSLPRLSFHNSGEVRRRVLSVLEKYAAGGVRDPVDLLDEEARKFLPVRAYENFRRIRLDRIYEPSFRAGYCRLVVAFSRYDAWIRQEIARLRRARKDRRNDDLTPPASALITAGNPLQEELQLMRLRWDKLEELCVGHYADLDALAAYKLKLMILLRWWSFETERGFELFRQLTKAS